MSPDSVAPIDLAQAHRHFSADCFNRTWDFIDKPDRSAEDDEAMVLSTLASLWHWTQRSDCTDQNRSIGHWQASRVYALVGQGDNARRHGERCLAFASGAPPFYVGYAHEALARAADVLGDAAAKERHLQEAWGCAGTVTDESARSALEQDLKTLSPAQ
ncbi:MAG TPA: hypothetical protein VHB77_03720 [Planctomycetaceae bacterium]|nr:hypothetical protein [Planctomycetaceae bacterium]